MHYCISRERGVVWELFWELPSSPAQICLSHTPEVQTHEVLAECYWRCTCSVPYPLSPGGTLGLVLQKRGWVVGRYVSRMGPRH